MSCHNAPYATKEENASCIIRKGEYIWRDYLGRGIYRFMNIGDKGHFLKPLSCPACDFIDSESKYWVKWIDSARLDMFIVPLRKYRCFGFVITFREFYFSFVCPPLV